MNYPITYRIVKETLWFKRELPKVYYRKGDLIKALGRITMPENTFYSVYVYHGEKRINIISI
jgi:hypothetical protein